MNQSECEDALLRALDEIETDEPLIVCSDHDPKPLFYQMKEGVEGVLAWGYLEKGDEVWRVAIGKRDK